MSAIVNADVAMLGFTGAGKTCFMYGMYAAFKERPAGFMLFTQDDDQDLDFLEAWRQIRQGKYPLGNDETPIPYTFEFRDGLNSLMDFTWIDYRGLVLRLKKDAPDRAKVLQQVNKADCLFLTISAEALTQSVNDRLFDVSIDFATDRMDTLTRDLPPKPTVILITKADLIPDRDPQDIIADVQNIFAPWFRDDHRRLVMICPVSIITRMNLEKPFIFTAYTLINRKMQEAEQLRNVYSDQLAERTEGLVGWWRETFGNATNEAMRRWIAQVSDDLRQLRERMQPLKKRLENTSIFYRGKQYDIRKD